MSSSAPVSAVGGVGWTRPSCTESWLTGQAEPKVNVVVHQPKTEWKDVRPSLTGAGTRQGLLVPGDDAQHNGECGRDLASSEIQETPGLSLIP